MDAIMVAQVGLPSTVGGWAVLIIIVAAIVGIVIVVVRQTGVVIPGWFVTICWILLAAAFGIIAIRFLLSLAGAG